VHVEPVILLDVWQTIHTLQVKMKPWLTLLSIESSPGSKKGSSDQQMTPELFISESHNVMIKTL
jgi:hypothetical protein